MRGRRAYGTGSVYRQTRKLASGKTVELGRFWLAYYVKGKLVREPANTTSKTEAERILRDRADIVRIGDETSLPMLLIEGAPFPAAETAGYFILEVSALELAELKCGGYRLLRALEPSGFRAAPESH